MPEIGDFLIRVRKGVDSCESLGCGFLIQNGYLITCAHVISDKSKPVYFDFPIIGSESLVADVIKIFPIKNNPLVEDVEDIALLKLTKGQTLPDKAKPANFFDGNENLIDVGVSMWGFPGNDRAGVPADGELKGENAMGYLHLNTETGRQSIKKGFSGTPVWIKDKCLVAGMIVSRREHDEFLTAYVIPAKKIQMALSTIGQFSRPEMVKPQPFVNPSEIIEPGGALDIDSSFYITRKCDDDVFNTICKTRGFVNLRGASQTGKSSLLVRTHAKIQSKKNLQPILINFQELEEDSFESINVLWRSIMADTAYQLNINGWSSDSWDKAMPYMRNVLQFLERYLFIKDVRPLLFCFDEVNQLFSFHVKDAFFKSIRALYDKGAHDDVCKKIRWILSTSSEPGFFIADLNGSPFNIGKPVTISAFNSDQTRELALRHGLDLKLGEIEEINDYVGSRPYLIHLLLYELATGERSFEALLNAQSAGQGAFRDHLKRYLKEFQKESDLRNGMIDVITGKGCKSVEITNRLEAAGLVLYNEEQKLVSSCGLYAGFFNGKL